MKTLGARGLKVLKICHLLFGIMWIGGVMALVSIMLVAQPQTKDMMYMAAWAHLIVDKYFLIPGGVGIVVVAILYGVFTKWGFFRHRWLTYKWVLTVLLIVLGAGYMGVVIEENFAYAQRLLSEDLPTDIFFANIRNVAISGIVQLVVFLLVIVISVFKPKNKATLRI